MLVSGRLVLRPDPRSHHEQREWVGGGRARAPRGFGGCTWDAQVGIRPHAVVTG